MFWKLTVVLACLLSVSAAEDRPTEVEWARQNWRKYVPDESRVEHRLWDGTRVDYLSATHAIEIDWAPKWAEAVGQALYYATLTEKPPAIILLVKNPTEEQKYVYRCQTLCAKHGIRLFVESVP